MDDLRDLTAKVDEAIPLNGGVNSVKVINTNPLEKNIIAKVGKMTGFPFTAKRSPVGGVVPSGCLFWNGNPMNTEEVFDIYISKFTLDGNYFTRIANLIEAGAILHFKDFAGRSTIFNVVEIVEAVDPATNPYLILSVTGFEENLDYTYQIDEELICMLEFLGNFNGAEYEMERIGNIVNLKKEDVIVSAVDIEADKLLSVGTITVAGNNVTVPNASAKIGGVVYAKATPTVLATPFTTPTYKRIDIIEINNLNQVVRKAGTETLATAIQIQPTVSAGAVLITTMYVSDSIIVTPPTTGNNFELSIRDFFDNEQFKITNFFRFKGFSFDPPTKMLIVDPLVGGVIFVSSTGNNATAQPENRNKPYQTLDAAIAAYWLSPSIDYIEIITDTAFTITTAITDNSVRKFDLRSQKSCTVNITRNGNLTSTTNNVAQTMNFYLPSGTLNFTPTTGAGFGASGQGKAIVVIEVGTVTFNSFWGATGNNITTLNIKSKVLNVNTTSGVMATPGGAPLVTIVSDTINFRGAGVRILGQWVSMNLTFGLITHDNTFFINSFNNGTVNITHGSISSVAPYVNTMVVEYLYKSTLNIDFVNGSTITSNLSIQGFNAVGVLNLKGICNFSNSEVLIRRNNQANSVFIKQANITCKRLFGEKDCFQNITIEDSIINITGTALGDMNKATNGQTFADPTLTFVGTNYVFISVDGGSLYVDDTPFWTAANKPTVNIQKGQLYTNGKFDRSKLVIKENPLNQYYDTIERQKVLVDEKEEIINKVLDPTKTYVINGSITLLTGEYIEIPAGGLTIAGYGFDTSVIVKNVAAQSIFKSPAGGSGNLVTKDIKYNSGLGMVFDIIDQNGTHAIELNDVNFENCSSIGKIKNYRQFTGLTVGIYGCSDGFTLSGTWNGYSMTKLHVRTFADTGTLFKKDVDTVFSNRFFLDSANISGVTGIKLLDFDNTIFTKDELLQISNSIFEVNGTISESNTAGLIPNISANDPKSWWTNSKGIRLTPVKYFDMRSPDGNAWRIEITNAGALTQTLI